MAKVNPEQRLTQEIMLFCGRNDMVVFHVNVGGGMLVDKLGNKTYFNTGLPKGFPDLHILGNGFVFYCETKIHPRKPTKEQLEWVRRLNERGIVAGVAYNLDEFIALYERARA